ncbi:MAG: HAMP domain-containing histidine kinase [Proteobacteria bacterium]|nr:HAMP domain-containing histidine kinase [Pseudomonadota bacterium]MBU4296006.1 HAMP domain-containing histidine kinase [Pseudomonadota bacterium]MCG2747257.1 HAMP domain-containing histidine kinase [Desulfobulbaceae bacterium]
MKIRQKITLWISITTLIAAVSFSSFVFLEMIEQPYYLIDSELKHMAAALLGQFQHNAGQALTVDEKSLPYPTAKYWIKLMDSKGATLFASAMTGYTDIPLLPLKKTYNVEKVIPREKIQLGQGDSDQVAFRVRVVSATLNNAGYTMVIAKPIEELEEEMRELLHELGAILITCFILGVLFSYNLAGRILQPIVTINRLVREINEKSLDKRIPLGKSKDELYTLSVSLNQMFDRLQNSFTRQKDFIASASHELKNPIALLLLSQEELLQTPDLPDHVRDDLASQHNSLQRMNRLIRNLLDLSGLEQQTALAREQVDLAELAEQVLEDYREVLAASLIALETDFEAELYVQGDQEKLRRLLINLIDNAIRYNRKTAGRLRIAGEKKMHAVHLSVSNTGPYVVQEDISRIFEQFYRVEKSRSTQFGGSGLGLAIAKRIVELHGGEICFTSREDGWNTITVRLPGKESV